MTPEVAPEFQKPEGARAATREALAGVASLGAENREPGTGQRATAASSAKKPWPKDFPSLTAVRDEFTDPTPSTSRR